MRVLGGTAELSNVHELDMIFVINATHAVTLLEKGNLVLGKDVTVGKGPTSLESDRNPSFPGKPDIYSYIWNKRDSSSINLNGAILTVYDRSNAYLYKREGLTLKDILEERGLEPPPAAGRFACGVRAYSNEGTLCG